MHLSLHLTKRALSRSVGLVAASSALAVTGCGSSSEPSPVSQTPSYNLVDLGGTASESVAFDINRFGHVIGNFAPAGSSTLSKGFLYKGGVWTTLSTANSERSYVNDRDQYFDSAGLFYTDGKPFDLSNTYSLNGKKFCPYAVNNNNAFAGSLDLSEGVDDPSAHAAVVVNGVVKDLGVLPGTSISSAGDINDSGQASGFSGSFPMGITTGHAVLFSSGKIIDLGVLPGDINSNSNRINNGGQVVGFSWNDTPNSTRYFLYASGQMKEIPLYPNDLNDNGDIVGGAKANIDTDPCIYHSGVLYHLRDCTALPAGWTLKSVTGINNQGQIAGVGVLNGHQHAILLAPR